MEEEKTRYNRSGKIKSRLFALILLMLSCSLCIVALKSLGREFKGMIVQKEVGSGFIPHKRYNLHIIENYQNIERNDIIALLMDSEATTERVGVSRFAYNEAEPSLIISKKEYSPIITIGDSKFIDQGLFWLFLSILGFAISFIIYLQTVKELKDADKNRSEDLDID